MESFEETINNLPEPFKSRLSSIRQSGERQTQQENPKKISTFECPICEDKEVVPTGERNTFTPCKCVEAKKARRIIEASGIGEGFRSKTVKEYRATTQEQRDARNIAIEYIRRFVEIEKEKRNCIAYLGNPGSGKTHLTIAIANALLGSGVAVRYMQYREAMTTLMQVRFDDEAYIKAIGPWKTCRVLLVDDLFKGAIRRDGTIGQESAIMFEILNHRYLGGKPVLFSSEYTIDRLIDLDEAVGSRVAEMARGRTVEFIGKHHNYRLNGQE